MDGRVKGWCDWCCCVRVSVDGDVVRSLVRVFAHVGVDRRWLNVKHGGVEQDWFPLVVEGGVGAVCRGRFGRLLELIGGTVCLGCGGHGEDAVIVVAVEAVVHPHPVRVEVSRHSSVSNITAIECASMGLSR